jgi:hypothetical protein
MSIEAMKKALEALDLALLDEPYFVKAGIAMVALRQAIEQAEKQEPFGYFQLDLRMDAWVQNRDNKKGVPFYTAPPKREWVGLTLDDKIQAHKIKQSSDVIDYVIYYIEAKLREKNT